MKVILTIFSIVFILYLMGSAVTASFNISQWHIVLRIVFVGWSLIAVYRYLNHITKD